MADPTIKAELEKLQALEASMKPVSDAEKQLNIKDSRRMAAIENRGDGEVAVSRQGDYRGAQQGDLHVASSPGIDAAILQGNIVGEHTYLSASNTGLVVSPKGIYGNGKVAAQAIMAVKGVFNDGVVDPQEAAALKNFVAEASGEHKLDPKTLATLKKFEGLEPEARHAILAKAGQLAGKENIATYADAALKIAEHFNPNQKDLSGAVDAAAQSLNLPKLAKGKAVEL